MPIRLRHAFLFTVHLSITSAALSACRPGDSDSEASELLYVTELIDAQTGEDTDSLPLFRIRDMVLAEGGLAILDSGNHRLLRLSPDLEILNSIGQQGAGPGEFELTNHLVDFDGQYIVSDVRNGRLSYLNPDGEATRVEILPATADYTGEFAVTSTGTLFVASMSDEYYLTTQEENGEWRGFGRRLSWPDRAPGSVDRTGMPKFDDLLITKGDTIYVLDNLYGVLIKMHPSVGMISAFHLPRSLIEPIQERDRRVSESLGGNSYSALFKDFRLSADGRFLLLFNVGDTIGVTIGQRDLRITPIIAPQSEERGPLRTASSAIIQGDTLFIGSEDGHPQLPPAFPARLQYASASSSSRSAAITDT